MIQIYCEEQYVIRLYLRWSWFSLHRTFSLPILLHLLVQQAWLTKQGSHLWWCFWSNPITNLCNIKDHQLLRKNYACFRVRWCLFLMISLKLAWNLLNLSGSLANSSLICTPSTFFLCSSKAFHAGEWVRDDISSR